MIQLFQQRDFGNKINVTFQYIIQNFRSLGTALLYIVGPVALAAGIMSGIMQSNMLKLAGSSRSSDPMMFLQMMTQFLSPAFWVTILAGFLANLAVILTTYGHMKIYNRLGQSATSDSITVADIWEEIQPSIGRIAIISILNSIITGVACMFLLIPGIYVGVVLSLSLAVTVFEETDFGATWERCFKLIRDKWWSTFGLIVVMGIITALAGIIFAIPSGIIGFLIAGKLIPDVSTLWLIVSNVIAIVGRTLLNTIIYTALGFQYTNLVERQEGRGMLSAIDSIGTNPAQPRATDEGSF